MIVHDLKPGMQFVMGLDGSTVTFVQQANHPLYTGLSLVIWWLGDRWSHDALSSIQDVGEPIYQYPTEYKKNLQRVFAAQRESVL